MTQIYGRLFLTYAALPRPDALIPSHVGQAITVDKWLHFRAARRAATLVKYLRVHMERLLLRKITHPQEDVSDNGRDLIQARNSTTKRWSRGKNQMAALLCMLPVYKPKCHCRHFSLEFGSEGGKDLEVSLCLGFVSAYSMRCGLRLNWYISLLSLLFVVNDKRIKIPSLCRLSRIRLMPPPRFLLHTSTDTHEAQAGRA